MHGSQLYSKIHNLSFFYTQALKNKFYIIPVSVMYIAKDDGSSAQQDMYIPDANMRNVNVNRPT